VDFRRGCRAYLRQMLLSKRLGCPSHVHRTVTAALLLLGACRAAPRPAPSSEGDAFVAPAAPVPSAAASAVVGAPTVPTAAPESSAAVRLRWRETDRRETRDRSGEHASVRLELLVEGGSPSRVDLGRRHAYGFHASMPEKGVLAGVESYVDAHGEYAQVTRPHPAELRIEAYGQDEAFPDHEPPKTNGRRFTVRVPADAGIEVVDGTEEGDGGG
jgi:hypothetical protein